MVRVSVRVDEGRKRGFEGIVRAIVMIWSLVRGDGGDRGHFFQCRVQKSVQLFYS